MDLLNKLKTKLPSHIWKKNTEWLELQEIKIDPKLEKIFVQKESDIEKIAEDMKKNGFDPAHPIILTYDNICADGHTRYKAAKRIGLKKVAVIYKEFKSYEELVEYAFKQQSNRRNLSDGEMYKVYLALRNNVDEKGKKEKTDQEIAEQLEISRRQVAKFNEVEKKAPKEILEELKNGKITLNKAYKRIKADENQNTNAHKIVTQNKTSQTYEQGFEDGVKSVLKALDEGKTSAEIKEILLTTQNEYKKAK